MNIFLVQLTKADCTYKSSSTDEKHLERKYLIHSLILGSVCSKNIWQQGYRRTGVFSSNHLLYPISYGVVPSKFTTLIMVAGTVRLKRRSVSTKRHGATSQKTEIFIHFAVKISNLT
jgi:hypothetical protein